ncbi:MAG: glucokinase [Paucibacter sp.]|nr:glucokinase [Roseateles sp.]
MSVPTEKFDSPRLIGDIGRTFARFALEVAPGVFTHIASLRCAEHADFHAAVSSYLASITDLPGGVQQIAHMGIAIANPVEGDQVRMTNYHWQFSIEQMRSRLGLDTLVVVNDFTALAMVLPRLTAADARKIGGGAPRMPSVVGVLGAGSGLGVSGLIPAGDSWVALGTEGGHTSFAPRDDRELAILRYGLQRYDHVSFERVLSGPGLELIRMALAERNGVKASEMSSPEISRRALSGECALCKEALEVFCTILGTAAANLAVTLGAFGGIYIGGRIVPMLGDFFDKSPFRARFEDRGRFHSYVASIPTYVITDEHSTFRGVSTILDSQLRTLQPDPGSAILGQIRRAREQLSPAELRVAEHVLERPRDVLNEPIAEIARAAQVSQPTVIRFCRSLGCEGLSDFKLRLASGLTGTVPVTHTQVQSDDSVVELGAKVLGNTASAILAVRSQLNRDMIDRAIALLQGARRIEFFARSHYSVVAQDAQYKFMRFGMPCAVHVEPRLQQLAAELLGPGDVAIVISASGSLPELMAVAERARERGARLIAITAGQSPLARKADAVLIVDHVEDVATQVPMVSRILHLLMIDILAVGVAMRRSPESLAAASADEDDLNTGAAPDAATRASPGVSVATPLARLTSHSR